MPESSIKLTVLPAKKRDINRNIARLEKIIMDELGIEVGDVIEIKKNGSTAGIAWPSDPKDHRHKIIRIDKRLRSNIGAKEGDEVEVAKAEVKIANSIELVPTSLKVRTNVRFESFIKRKLINLPVTTQDIINVSIGISREIAFKVLSLSPEGVCVIKNSTHLIITDHSEEDFSEAILSALDFVRKVKKMIDSNESGFAITYEIETQIYDIARSFEYKNIRDALQDLIDLIYIPKSFGRNKFMVNEEYIESIKDFNLFREKIEFIEKELDYEKYKLEKEK